MPIDINLLKNTLKKMKEIYENAIREGKYTELIRSQKLIGMLHEFAIQELRKRFPSQWIYRDKPVYGYPKTKTQDILIQPPQNSGQNLSIGPIATINVRSQLSSIEKNYDTLFERLFAEALNLHNRFPYLVLGYLYLLPKIGYDEKAAKNREVKFAERYNMEKYIQSFFSIANRQSPNDSPWKYERITLLIVDFEQDPPVILDSMNDFLKEGLVRENFANLFSFEQLSIQNFFDEIHKIAVQRYYLLLGR
ncbi:MAG: hypothetical protein ACP5IZ_11195 [Thermoprotei archaeon]|jgi:hypothetical protein